MPFTGNSSWGVTEAQKRRKRGLTDTFCPSLPSFLTLLLPRSFFPLTRSCRLQPLSLFLIKEASSHIRSSVAYGLCWLETRLFSQSLIERSGKGFCGAAYMCVSVCLCLSVRCCPLSPTPLCGGGLGPLILTDSFEGVKG